MHRIPRLVIPALFVFGCGGSGTPGPTSTMVGSSGGTVRSGDVSLTIPPGALSQDVAITITPSSNRPATALGPAFDLEPEGMTFAMPVKVTLPFSPSELSAEEDASVVRVLTAAKGSTDFVAVDGTVVDSNHIEVETTHFSTWVAGKTAIAPLVAGLNFPDAVGVDMANVYWLDYGGMPAATSGRVMMRPLAGGMPTVLAQGLMDPKRLAVANGNVYFTTGGNGGMTGSVGFVPIAGGAVTLLGQGLPFPRAIWVDATSVYWTDYDDGSIRKVSATGGSMGMMMGGNNQMMGENNQMGPMTSPTMGDAREPTTGQVLAAAVVFASGQKKVESLWGDASNLYWTSSVDGTVMKLAKTGGTPTALATLQAAPAGITGDSTYLYWINQGTGNNGTISRVPKGGGTILTLITGLKKPWQLAVNSTNVYWLEKGPGAVKRALLTGLSQVTLASARAVPFGIALDASFVYWVDNGNKPLDGSLLRVAK